jgi:hypothetical protein
VHPGTFVRGGAIKKSVGRSEGAVEMALTD